MVSVERLDRLLIVLRWRRAQQFETADASCHVWRARLFWPEQEDGAMFNASLPTGLPLVNVDWMVNMHSYLWRWRNQADTWSAVTTFGYVRQHFPPWQLTTFARLSHPEKAPSPISVTEAPMTTSKPPQA